ncbi:hypothetical protein BH10PSE3_BH10PSE3_26130 [soil metagenome]
MSGSPKPKRVKLRRGDLFEFATADGRFAYGVVLTPGGVLNAFFLKTLHTSRPAFATLVKDEVALIGTTMDALFYHGQWVVVDRDFPIRPGLPFPNWKVGIGGTLHATDFEGEFYWPIRADEIDLLDYKFSCSPMTFQNALEALNGIGEWREDYERLTPAYAKRRVTRA